MVLTGSRIKSTEGQRLKICDTIIKVWQCANFAQVCNNPTVLYFRVNFLMLTFFRFVIRAVLLAIFLLRKLRLWFFCGFFVPQIFL